ncbi:sugar phosphate isomerase/epimerase family protein [Pararhizobium mangrovi]|uniref:Sugar phosphate isomerase/epimerase n=1 Tax=Pararhizobium mangrovi TaxID=2590452 RepID=A0A506U4V6_9HYPH|nr:sugar phosphate isomerase/epimerase [Pararhizobium mangrovi]TPW28104.1 sugar phosphate isomerase/epimerase [Pararhizobium mangrovi]
MIANDVSFQLFSSRASDSLDEQLSFLAGLGYTDVQPFFFAPPDDMATVRGDAERVRKHGLTARSGHFTLDFFEEAGDRLEEIAGLYGMSLVVVPWIAPEDRPETGEGWREIGRRLSAYRNDAERRGLAFAYHNHDFEMVPLADGSYPLDHLLGKDVPLEPDLAWMVKANARPEEWLAKYAGRIPAVHVKDVAPSGECLDEMGFADVGHGTMDWPRLWERSLAAGAGLMVVEHDKPSDWKRFASRTIEAVRGFAS